MSNVHLIDLRGRRRIPPFGKNLREIRRLVRDQLKPPPTRVVSKRWRPRHYWLYVAALLIVTLPLYPAMLLFMNRVATYEYLSRDAPYVIDILSVVYEFIKKGDVGKWERADVSWKAMRVSVMIIAMLLACFVGVASLFLNRAARLRKPTASELLAHDKRPPVLLIRAFSDDDAEIRYFHWQTLLPVYQRVETTIEGELTRIGPFVAIGRPGEMLPPLGAARDYLKDDAWREHVVALMDRARMVVMIPSNSDGLNWEIDQIVHRGLWRKMVILLGTRRERLDVDNLLAHIPMNSVKSLKEMNMSERMWRSTVALGFLANGDIILVRRSNNWTLENYIDAVQLMLFGSMSAEAEVTADIG